MADETITTAPAADTSASDTAATTQPDAAPSPESAYDWQPPAVGHGDAESQSKPDGDVVSADPKTDTDDGSRTSDTPDTDTPEDIDAELLAQSDAWGISREVAYKLGEAGLAREVNRLWARHAVSNAQRETRAQTPEQLDELADVLKQIDEDPDGYDDKFKAALKGLYERTLRQDRLLQEYARGVDEQRTALRMDDMRRETEEWDRLFNESDMEDIFGKGNYGDMKADSPGMKNRMRVMEQVNVQHELAKRRGEKVSNRDLLIRAASYEFPDRQMRQATQQLAEKVSSRASQTIARPSARKSGPVSADQRAIEAVAETMRKHGMRVEEDSTSFAQF